MNIEWHKYLFNFTFYYPLFMSYVWIAGGIVYFIRFERKSLNVNCLTRLASTPVVSVLVPCYNEEDNIAEVVGNLARLDYPNYEIICINDGSKDNTGRILDTLRLSYPMLRVIHQAKNQGKAVGLTTAALIAKSEYLLCIDGDAVIDRDAISAMLWHFQNGLKVAAVTGNPRVRTRSSLLGRLQVGEFSSIIGLTKRAQRVYGSIFTVSGVIVMFSRRALMDVGFWSPEMLTEDIDISWKLQMRNWEIRFEPRAIAWILMPETLNGLWKQRLRWSMGGIQVIRKYCNVFLNINMRHMWIIYCEYLTSIAWAFCMAAVTLLWIVGWIIDLPPEWQTSMLPGWHGLILGATCLLQFSVSMTLDSRYDKNLFRQFGCLIWYPIVYWTISMLTTIVGVPKVLLRQKGQRAIWISPDRGLQSLQGKLTSLTPLGSPSSITKARFLSPVWVNIYFGASFALAVTGVSFVMLAPLSSSKYETMQEPVIRVEPANSIKFIYPNRDVDHNKPEDASGNLKPDNNRAGETLGSDNKIWDKDGANSSSPPGIIPNFSPPSAAENSVDIAVGSTKQFEQNTLENGQECAPSILAMGLCDLLHTK